jgi:hypothetical protein
MTTVCAWEKTVVMVKQPGHLTSMKKDLGAGTRFWWQGQFFDLPRALGASDMIEISYLKLVLASLSGWGWVEEINGENLFQVAPR